MTITLEGTGLKKVFNRRTIFDKVSFSVSYGQTLLVTGKNGSGKSTLVKIISDVLTPTAGSVSLSIDGKKTEEPLTTNIGLVSPYLQMYDEFSAEENLRYAITLRGEEPDAARISSLLKKVFLDRRKDDPVRTYSSGMKQRMKYAFALSGNPPVLILDEPTSNLDTEGIAMVREIMSEQMVRGILVVATNDLGDVDEYHARVDLNG